MDKYCPSCEQTLDAATHFYTNKAQPSGYGTYCKKCTLDKRKTPEVREKDAARMRAWNAEHREKVNANALDAYHELQERRQTDPELDAHLRALARAKSARKRQRDPEGTKESLAKYAANNKPKINARRRASYAEDPTRVKSEAAKRYATRKGNPDDGTLTPEAWEMIKAAYDYRCVYCPPNCRWCRTKTHVLTRDHITPVVKGGANSIQNIVPACRSCNGRKQDGPAPFLIQPLLL